MKDTLKLTRLERLMDVVFALLLFRMFRLFPGVAEVTPELDRVHKILTAYSLDILVIVVALILVIFYWNQNNVLLGKLAGTNSVHTSISIVHIFCLLLFLYSIRMGTKVQTGLDTRLLESVTASLVGYTSVLAWAYAIKKRRLLKNDVSDKDARKIFKNILSEPLAATLTIPCAFMGPVIWEIAWLSFIPFAQILKRLHWGDLLNDR